MDKRSDLGQSGGRRFANKDLDLGRHFMSRVTALVSTASETTLYVDERPVRLTAETLFFLADARAAHLVTWQGNVPTWRGPAEAPVAVPIRLDWPIPGLHVANIPMPKHTCRRHGKATRWLCGSSATCWGGLDASALWALVRDKNVPVLDAWLWLRHARDPATLLGLATRWPSLRACMTAEWTPATASRALAIWAERRIAAARRANPRPGALLSLFVRPQAWPPLDLAVLRHELGERGLEWPLDRAYQYEDGRPLLLTTTPMEEAAARIPYTAECVSVADLVAGRPKGEEWMAKRPLTSLVVRATFGGGMHLGAGTPPTTPPHIRAHGLTWTGGTRLLSREPERWTHVLVLDAHWLTASVWEALQDAIIARREANGQRGDAGTVTLAICPVFEYASGYRVGRRLLGRRMTDMEDLFYPPMADVARQFVGTLMDAPVGEKSQLASAGKRVWPLLVAQRCTAEDDGAVWCRTVDMAVHADDYKAAAAMGLVAQPWTELAPLLLSHVPVMNLGKARIHVPKANLWRWARDEL